MTEGSLQQISAAEFQQSVGKFMDDAGRGPVVITKHKRPSRVLIDVEEYNRLKAFDLRKAFYAHEIPTEAIEALKATSYEHLDPSRDALME
jgi:prevent-host-death family protein